MSRRAIPIEIERALDAAGLPWSIEHGKRHMKIVSGQRLLFVMSHGRKGCGDPARGMKNTLARIRRIAEGRPE